MFTLGTIACPICAATLLPVTFNVEPDGMQAEALLRCTGCRRKLSLFAHLVHVAEKVPDSPPSPREPKEEARQVGTPVEGLADLDHVDDEHRILHAEDHKTDDGFYECPHCPEVFDRGASWASHLRSHEVPEPCPHGCGRQIKPSGLGRHVAWGCSAIKTAPSQEDQPCPTPSDSTSSSSQPSSPATASSGSPSSTAPPASAATSAAAPTPSQKSPTPSSKPDASRPPTSASKPTAPTRPAKNPTPSGSPSSGAPVTPPSARTTTARTGGTTATTSRAAAPRTAPSPRTRKARTMSQEATEAARAAAAAKASASKTARAPMTPKASTTSGAAADPPPVDSDKAPPPLAARSSTARCGWQDEAGPCGRGKDPQDKGWRRARTPQGWMDLCPDHRDVDDADVADLLNADSLPARV